MNRNTAHSLTITPATTPADLHAFLKGMPPNARVRENNGVLFCREGRKGNSLTHAGEFLTGKTADKRIRLMGLIESVFDRHGKKLHSEIERTSSIKVLNRLKSADGDLKVKHLLSVFEGKVIAGNKEYTFNRLSPMAKGAYGQVFCAWDENHERYLALKTPLSAVPEVGDVRDPSSVKDSVEVQMHVRAFKNQIADVNYVVETSSTAVTSDHLLVQPMSLALCSGEKLLQALARPSHEFPTESLTLLTVQDWLMSLAQIQSVDMAHRDIKPENWLLSQHGVWQLSDFGTAGDVAQDFVIPKTKAHRTTGNGTVLNKSPEWLKMEASGAVQQTYRVGEKDDVFALGVAVFRLLTGGQMPFQTPDNESGLETVYEEAVMNFADSKLPFSEWYRENGQGKLPLIWQGFLNRALEADPQARASVDVLLAAPIFKDLSALSVDELRQQMVLLAHSQ